MDAHAVAADDATATMDEPDDDDDDDKVDTWKTAAKGRQRAVEASQVLAVCSEWACIAPVHALLHLANSGTAPQPVPLGTKALSCACFDPTGTRLLVGGSEDKQVLLYDELPPKAAPRSWTGNKRIGCVAFAPDGGSALWADLFGEVHMVSLAGTSAEMSHVTVPLCRVVTFVGMARTEGLARADMTAGYVRFDKPWTPSPGPGP